MTTKELNKENQLLKEVIEAFIENMEMANNQYAQLLRYYYTQHKWDEIIKYLIGE